MYKWLIIHPQDETTDFLKKCYQNIQDKVVIQDVFTPNNQVRRLLRDCENVMILGHGTRYGLIASYKGVPQRLIINSNHVAELRKKNKVIGIWCYASTFFKKYEVSGFATSMYVSDIDEAADNMLPLRYSLIEESNLKLTETICEHYDSTPIDLYANLKLNFLPIRENAIAMFNSDGFKWFNYKQ